MKWTIFLVHRSFAYTLVTFSEGFIYWREVSGVDETFDEVSVGWIGNLLATSQSLYISYAPDNSINIQNQITRDHFIYPFRHNSIFDLDSFITVELNQPHSVSLITLSKYTYRTQSLEIVWNICY